MAVACSAALIPLAYQLDSTKQRFLSPYAWLGISRDVLTWMHSRAVIKRLMNDDDVHP
jgi:hypothetical protein